MIRKLLIAAVGLVALGISPAAAQDFTLNPTFGQVNLNAGFAPDPHSVAIVAGGGIDANTALGTDTRGNACLGMIANAPDYRVNYTSGSWPLIFNAIASDDTTLVINAPNGQWYCDDDGAGYPNPRIEFSNPQSGQYDIWIGAYSGGNPNVTLNVTELGGAAPPPVAPPAPPPAAAMPDFTLNPTFGQVNLNAGFTPDPHTVNLTAGGNIDANAALGGSCRGDIATAPDYSVNYTAGGGWPLIISATANSDTTLVVNGPDGQWYCDDDSGGNLNPRITFNNPQSGRYDIWVGTYSGGTTSATLNISELSGGGPAAPPPVTQPPVTPPPAAGGLMPDFGLPPTFGQVNLNAGFTPDPHTVAIVAGGPVDAGEALGTDANGNYCIGTIAEAPDYRVNYTSGSWPLIFNVMASEDTTLVINAPDGQWYCNDDGAGYPNPEIAFDTPMSGQYDIWIGAFSGGNPNATLNVTELGGTGRTTPPPAPPPAPVAPPAKPAPVAPPPVAPPPVAPPPPPPPAAAMPDFTLNPTFGQINLTAGFTPDPHSVAIVAGGPVDAGNALGTGANGNYCVGTIAEAPDYRINYTSGSWPLIFNVMASEDTTLVINAPDGQWYCDDDGAGYPNPEIAFDTPMSGQYDIWIGAYSGGNPDATLNITEIGGGAGPVTPPPVTPPPVTPPLAGGGMPDFALPPTFGQVTLNAGFAPDPHTVNLTAGGNIDAFAALGGSCRGDIATAPDYSLNYTSGSWPLYIWAIANVDTTIVINGPDGQWYCDDDSAGSLNPLFEFSNPQSGRYDIWVGTYSGGTAPATLHISELGL